MSRLLTRVKRVLTGILTAALVVTSFPTYAYATEVTDDTDNAVVMSESTEDVLTVVLFPLF